jgi:hypothetical protein
MNKQLIYDLAVKHKHICGELPLNVVEELALVGLELFAEVIVRECIKSIQSDMDRETMNGTISLAKHAGMVSAKTVIKKHFGVEE